MPPRVKAGELSDEAKLADGVWGEWAYHNNVQNVTLETTSVHGVHYTPITPTCWTGESVINPHEWIGQCEGGVDFSVICPARHRL